jgi:hypothetical protein
MKGFIEQIGEIKIDNGFNSFFIELKNKSLKSIWLSAQYKPNIISSVIFYNPKITENELLEFCPEATKKYIAHDDQYVYVCQINQFNIEAALGERQKIITISLSWI